MSELQELCDALTAINRDIMQMAQDLHAKSQVYNRAAASAAAAARSADGEASAALGRAVAALNAAALHCGRAAQLLAGAGSEGQAFVQRTAGTGGSGSARSGAEAEEADDAREAQPASSTLSAELRVLRSAAPNRQQLGDFCEAVAAGLVALVEDQGLLSQHNPGDDPHGIDILAVDLDGKVHAFEVKGTALKDAGKPRTSNTRTGRQGGARWLVNRSASGPIPIPSEQAVGDAIDQVASKLIRVNIATGEVSMWSVDARGRTAATPEAMYPLDDVVAAIDGA